MKKCKHCGDELSSARRGLQCTTCKNGLDRYGLTKLDMLKMHEAQNGKCALCNKDIKMFSKYEGGYIDHCHKTGKIRSVLCHGCNKTLGYLENHINFKALTEYICP